VRRHAWGFYPEDALPYFYNVRLYERELLRNVTEREILNYSRSQVVIIGGTIVWIFFIGSILCVCCSCPCLCFYCQQRRKAAEKVRMEEVLWSQQLEMVIQATQRQQQAKERLARQKAVQYDPKARIARPTGKSNAVLQRFKSCRV